MITDLQHPPLLKHSTHRWALSNFGNIWGVFRTRKEAIQDAEFAMDKPWRKIKASMEVRKVTIIEGWD